MAGGISGREGGAKAVEDQGENGIEPSACKGKLLHPRDGNTVEITDGRIQDFQNLQN